MDCLGQMLGPILAETGRSMWRSTYTRATYTIRFKSNINALKNALDGLMEVQNKVNKDLKTLEIKRKSLHVQLRRWLRDVEEIVSEAKSMHEGRATCFLSLKCRLSKKLVVILEKVKRLEKQGVELLDIFSVEGKSELVEKILGPSIPYQTRASEMLVKVVNFLRSDEVQKIGVWGMGGVGKTTLVRELNNKLWKEAATQPFGMVIWATVSKEFELARVQKQIAERLDMEIKLGENEEKLARRIFARLEKVSSFLLILDDVWKPIDLDQLGIPQTDGHKGSKIVLTSRFLEVCQSIKTDMNFRVDCLCEEEAWELFCQNAGEVTRSDRIRPIAKKVSRECGGLPLAIITVGMAMRGKKMVKLWKHALKELKSSVPYVKSIEEKIYQPLKLSYDLLEQKMKSCLLFCALFPEDYSIEVAELVKYWTAAGFIDEIQNHGYLMNQGITLVENLRDSCLLEEGAHDDTVKMHDVVRDFAIWVMSSSKDDSHALVMSGTGLCEFPEEKFVPSIRRVSLMNNKLKKLPNQVVECVALSALLLQGNFHLEELPDGFLLSFPALRILNLSGTRIKSLPNSLSKLHELRSLILRDCYYLEEVPSLEGLTKILVLDLCATHIRESPRGLETLNSLRLLDLSRTHNLESIPAGIIPQLSSLEVLDMTLSHFHWGVQGQTQKGQATLEEIACLHRLSVLSIRVVCVPPLSPESNSWTERLKKFQLFIGPTANSLPTRHDKRRVTISSLNVSEAFIGWLLVNTTSLVMNHCWGLNEMLENLVIDSTSSFNMLKSLTVESFGGSIRPAGGCVAQLDLLPNLEELHLRRVNLETIRELVGHLGLRFETLRHLEVSRCSRLKCLLSLGNFICFLPNLQEIHVSFCERLQELFEYSPGEVPASASVVPALRVIKLRNLPRLRRLCSQEMSWGCLEHVEVIRCNLVKNLPISSSNAHRVKEVRGETHWWNDLTWDDNSTRETLQPRFVPADGNILDGLL
ncbi:disease resistance protein At4g27190 isoform X1 [Eutrema salsugineum]|uniref:disease resistance protein At4g27190 isoform X1 n=2 Tax=Eutrema salsugineum TaxID=72664 RepID=UPI000CED31E4|nr:disease resistance protein At4g27190 isoform X1 [Eutrema salsugineum]